MFMKKFIFLFLVITWLVAIYSFSNMDSNKSNTKSKEAINKVVSGTIKVKDEIENKINNTSNITSKEEINKITNKLNLSFLLPKVLQNPTGFRYLGRYQKKGRRLYQQRYILENALVLS